MDISNSIKFTPFSSHLSRQHPSIYPGNYPGITPSFNTHLSKHSTWCQINNHHHVTIIAIFAYIYHFYSRHLAI